MEITSFLDQYPNNLSDDDDHDQVVRQLPYEIVEEILLQLPVKSLVRFKCVCKPWLALISDPAFIKSHLLIINRSSKQDQDDDDDEGALPLMLSSASLLQSLHVQANSTSSSISDPTRVVVHEYPPAVQAARRPAEVKDMKIVGSCNGLLCLVVDSQDMMIYNPSTRQAQGVPPAPAPAPPPTLLTSTSPITTTGGNKDYFYGFGYDSHKDDFKIVRATSSSKDGIFATQLDMFSLKANTWRAATKTIPNCHFMSNVVGTLLNGALHWLARRRRPPPGISTSDDDCCDDERPFSIVSFDLTEETHRHVPLPVDGDKSFCFYGLGVLGGRLSMLHSPNNIHMNGSSDPDYEVWLMNEYGSKASWTVFTSIPQKMDSEYLGLMSLVSILDNGEILILLHQRKLIVYNPAGKSFRTVFSGDIHSSQVALYMKSLVSPIIINSFVK